MDGVNDTIWSEIVEVVGKRFIPSEIIDPALKQKTEFCISKNK